MRKVLCILIFIISVAAVFTGCGKEAEPIATEFDDKEIAQIKTMYYGGYRLVDSRPIRIFDFTEGTVTDEVELDETAIEFLIERYNSNSQAHSVYESEDEYRAYLSDHYNNPAVTATFSSVQAEEFRNEARLKGFYGWKDSYISDMVDDEIWSSVTITFTDGTVKTTTFYMDFPKNYDKIGDVFKTKLGAAMMLNTF